MVVYFQKVLNVKIIVHLFVFCTVIPCAFSQNVQENPLVSAIIEDFLENSDSENFDFNTVFENLSYYYNHPLDINSATEQELRDLIIISESQINAFIDHRNKFGKFLSIYELQTIDSWNINFNGKILTILHTQQKDIKTNIIYIYI